jgi:hypothetical protein
LQTGKGRGDKAKGLEKGGFQTGKGAKLQRRTCSHRPIQYRPPYHLHTGMHAHAGYEKGIRKILQYLTSGGLCQDFSRISNQNTEYALVCRERDGGGGETETDRHTERGCDKRERGRDTKQNRERLAGRW